MAQITTRKTALAVALCALFGTGVVGAADVPASGIAAESRSDWAAAAQVYRDALNAHPDDATLWRRLSDVEARQGHAAAAANALESAAALQPADAELQASDSQAWAVAQDPRKALAAIQRALALAPDNVDYLISQSQLANWTGDYALSEKSLSRVQQLAPQREDILAGVARSTAWRGDLGKAIKLMRRYLDKYPQDKGAWLDLARYYAWRGNYPDAADILADYFHRFGVDDGANALLARIYAWAEWRHHALDLNTPLVQGAADNYEANYTQALALLKGYVPREALPYAAAAQRIKPDVKETLDLMRVVDTRVDSYIEVPLSRSWDSQGISLRHIQAGLDWWLGDKTTLLVDAGWNRYGARTGSPFATADGGDHVNESRLRIGLRQALNDDYALEGWGGASHFSASGGSTGIGSLALLAQPRDEWRWRANVERDRVGVSPLAASLGINRNGGMIEAWWTPNLRWTVDAYVRHDNYSDSNQRDEVAFAVRRATVRNGWLMLDLGVSGQWFGFDHNRHDGYYAPSDYRRFALTAGAYFHISDDIGLQTQAGLGRQRDETFTAWRRANDINANLVFGINSPWQLSLSAGYSQRILNTGAYAGHTWGATLTRRF